MFSFWSKEQGNASQSVAEELTKFSGKYTCRPPWGRGQNSWALGKVSQDLMKTWAIFPLLKSLCLTMIVLLCPSQFKASTSPPSHAGQPMNIWPSSTPRGGEFESRLAGVENFNWKCPVFPVKYKCCMIIEIWRCLNTKGHYKRRGTTGSSKSFVNQPWWHAVLYIQNSLGCSLSKVSDSMQISQKLLTDKFLPFHHNGRICQGLYTLPLIKTVFICSSDL